MLSLLENEKPKNDPTLLIFNVVIKLYILLKTHFLPKTLKVCVLLLHFTSALVCTCN